MTITGSICTMWHQWKLTLILVDCKSEKLLFANRGMWTLVSVAQGGKFAWVYRCSAPHCTYNYRIRVGWHLITSQVVPRSSRTHTYGNSYCIILTCTAIADVASYQIALLKSNIIANICELSSSPLAKSWMVRISWDSQERPLWKARVIAYAAIIQVGHYMVVEYML